MKLRPSRVELAAVRRRLELLLKAHYGRDFDIVGDLSRPPRWWERLFADARSPSRSPEPVAGIEVEHIVLPAQLPASDRDVSAAERYRLLAMAGAERVVRGSLDAHARCETRLERELLWVREGVMVDAAIARRMPALEPVIARARRHMSAARPRRPSLAPREAEVESLIVTALASAPREVAPVFETGDDAESSLGWARRRGWHGRQAAARWGLERAERP